MLEKEMKRIFFALEVNAPWPENFPKGRLLDFTDRHATLAFLGEVNDKPLIQALNHCFPRPSFHVGLMGFFSECLLLPPRHPHVVAWHVEWLDSEIRLIQFREILLSWLHSLHYPCKEPAEKWLCHVTLCRQPFDRDSWKKTFKPLPMYFQALHLYESLGNSRYKPLWSYPFIPPFEEIEHTADVAYLIRGEGLNQIYAHAMGALAFRYPPLLSYIKEKKFEHFDDLIIDLNNSIAQADADIGCPFKAISFHGNLEKKDLILHWEMIVDV